MVPALLGLLSKVQTLLDRLTSTRAGYLDRLDATISSRASASVWTSAIAARIDDTITSRAKRPVVQTGFLSATGGAIGTGTGEDWRYANVTISAVSGTTNCAVLLEGPGGCIYNSDTQTYQSAFPATGRLTSTTNLRISVISVTPFSHIICRWTVIDYGS